MGQRTWRVWASTITTLVISGLVAAILLWATHPPGDTPRRGLANWSSEPTSRNHTTRQKGFLAGTLPPVLMQAVEHARSAERIEVTWDEQGSHAALIKVGSRLQLTLTAQVSAESVQNIITVIDDTAYIEDHGYHFDKPLVRFKLPVTDTFSFDVGHHWEEDLLLASAEQLTITENGLLKTYTVTDSSLTTFTYNFSFRDEHSVSIPSWSNQPDDIASTWDDELPSGRPDWLDAVAKVSIDPETPSAIDGSQCGASPFVPSMLPSGIGALPVGAVFVCQVNLSDVPGELGLPKKGLLQFFIVNEFESGFVRYFPAPLSLDHNLVAAARISIDETKPKGTLRFRLSYTSDELAIEQHAPRSQRFQKARSYSVHYGESGSQFVRALAVRGMGFTPNDVNMMGGHWTANGATEAGYSRLFMIGDDVGYSYWHIPTGDTAGARFDRVLGGWTD